MNEQITVTEVSADVNIISKSVGQSHWGHQQRNIVAADLNDTKKTSEKTADKIKLIQKAFEMNTHFKPENLELFCQLNNNKLTRTQKVKFQRTVKGLENVLFN